MHYEDYGGSPLISYFYERDTSSRTCTYIQVSYSSRPVNRPYENCIFVFFRNFCKIVSKFFFLSEYVPRLNIPRNIRGNGPLNSNLQNEAEFVWSDIVTLPGKVGVSVGARRPPTLPASEGAGRGGLCYAVLVLTLFDGGGTAAFERSLEPGAAACGSLFDRSLGIPCRFKASFWSAAAWETILLRAARATHACRARSRNVSYKGKLENSPLGFRVSEPCVRVSSSANHNYLCPIVELPTGQKIPKSQRSSVQGYVIAFGSVLRRTPC